MLCFVKQNIEMNGGEYETNRLRFYRGESQ